MELDSDLDSIRVNKSSQKTYNGPDLISNLPDFVIGDILSFLPTKDAIRTCVLSKRWRYIWTSIIKLSFDDRNGYSLPRKTQIKKIFFMESIRKVFLSLKSMSLDSFTLFISRDYKPNDFNLWISNLSIMKVKKIYINSNYRFHRIPSNVLLECHSLEELHLKRCDIQIPTFVSLSYLSYLTVLELSELVIINGGNSSDKWTLNLPSLKEYIQKDCSWEYVKTVSFEMPLLEVLRISNSFYLYELPEFVFSAVSLKRLYYSGYGLTQTPDLLVVLVHFASAEIKLYLEKDGVQGVWNFVCKLITNVKCLKFVHHPPVYTKIEYPFLDIPSFERLVHLELVDCPTNLLLDFLLKAPCLQTLILQSIFWVEPLNFAIVPDCFLYTLKVLKFQRFEGEEDQLIIAKFLVENAKVLEQISFSYHTHGLMKSKIERIEKVKEKLFSFKRSSSLVLIEFQRLS